MIPSLRFLHDGLSVEALDDDQVAVTVILPSDLVRSYCLFLDSLTGLYRATDRHCTIARAFARAASREPDQNAEARRAAYRDRLVTAYDQYTAKGLSRNAAIKQIAADLRADNHPWRTVDVIRSTLVAAGRDGYSRRSRGGKS